MKAPAPALEVSGLTTRLDVAEPVCGVDLTLAGGETVALVGESGSGKTMTALSVIGLLPPGARVVAGSVRLGGRELVGAPEEELRLVRGREIAMVLQGSATALDPTRTVGYQVAEPLRHHLGLSRRAASARASELLGRAGVPRPLERLGQYPHQLSGGLRQRVLIAAALACGPRVLIADEPTTGLDVPVQAQILDLLDRLKSELGLAVLLITHDLALASGHADRVAVMYAGRVVEEAPARAMTAGMRHPYSRALLACAPTLAADRSLPLPVLPGRPPGPGEAGEGCRFAPRCPAVHDDCRRSEPPLAGEGHRLACWHPWHPGGGAATSASPSPGGSLPAGPLSAPRAVPVVDAPAVAVLEAVDLVKEYRLRRRLAGSGAAGVLRALSGVSVAVGQAETVGLVGESGCGKSTLARLLVGLERPDSGTVRVDGTDLLAGKGRDRRRRRREVQMTFQDPYGSLDPRMPVGSTIAEPLVVAGTAGRRERRALVRQLLDEVGLPASAAARRPRELSGGERQRVGLARALAMRPRVLVADEPVAALDASVRSQILNLLRQVQADHGLSLLVVSHDLAAVRYLAGRVGVMYLGKLVEMGPVDEVYNRPAHPYAAALLASIDRTVLAGEPPSVVDPPSGCPFRTRCPRAEQLCAEVEPPLVELRPRHRAACHFPLRQQTGPPNPA